ncbi:MAG: DUF3387 domain-containing protein [Bacteroidales bacterium]|nr:DUF3387 domain-containing protein [Bacteroidales bacterium]
MSFSELNSVEYYMFHGYDYSLFLTGTDLQRAKAITGATNFISAVNKEEQKQSFIKEAYLLHQSLTLCSSLLDTISGTKRLSLRLFARLWFA